MTPLPDEDVAALQAALEKMTPSHQWSVSARGDTIVRGDSPDRCNRHPQTHLQMVPPEDAQGIVTIMRLLPRVLAERTELKDYIAQKEKAQCRGEWPCEASTALASWEPELQRLDDLEAQLHRARGEAEEKGAST